MQKNIDFNQLDTMVVKNEKVSGIAINFNALKADGTLAPLSSYSHVSIEIRVKRAGGSPMPIFNGYLDDLLHALYAQTPSFELYKKAYGLTHKVLIDFGGVIALKNDDCLEVVVRATNLTFTSLSVGNSGMQVETVPASGYQTPVFVVDSVGIPTSETNITLPIGDNVVKAVVLTDRENTYFDSTEAKLDGVEITADNGFVKNVSQELLEIENISYFSNNPESPIEDLVIYASPNPISGATVRGKFNKSVLPNSKIMVVRRASI